jgi:hypothetical protein
MKYEYKKVTGYEQKKFIENGHTMFEEDVLQRLKRLAYLEEQFKQTNGADTGQHNMTTNELLREFIEWRNSLEPDRNKISKSSGNIFLKNHRPEFKNLEILPVSVRSEQFTCKNCGHHTAIYRKYSGKFSCERCAFICK